MAFEVAIAIVYFIVIFVCTKLALELEAEHGPIKLLLLMASIWIMVSAVNFAVELVDINLGPTSDSYQILSTVIIIVQYVAAIISVWMGGYLIIKGLLWARKRLESDMTEIERQTKKQ